MLSNCEKHRKLVTGYGLPFYYVPANKDNRRESELLAYALEVTDFLVLATGTSEPHLRALRIELEKALDGARVPIVGVENTQGSGWTVFDAFEIMVHLFTAENRAKYRLELLWKDAEEISVQAFLIRQGAEKPVARRKSLKKRQ